MSKFFNSDDTNDLFVGCQAPHTHIYVQHECAKSAAELESANLNCIFVVMIASISAIFFILNAEYVERTMDLDGKAYDAYTVTV